jgi:hypothetical protein
MLYISSAYVSPPLSLAMTFYTVTANVVFPLKVIQYSLHIFMRHKIQLCSAFPWLRCSPPPPSPVICPSRLRHRAAAYFLYFQRTFVFPYLTGRIEGP